MGWWCRHGDTGKAAGGWGNRCEGIFGDEVEVILVNRAILEKYIRDGKKFHR